MSTLVPLQKPPLDEEYGGAWAPEAPHVNEINPPPIDGAGVNRSGPRFPLVPFDAIRPDEGATYLIKGLFPRVGFAVVWGEPKCGKTFWTFDALMHVALGWPYRGHRVTCGPVVYCVLEGAAGFRRRKEAFRLTKMSEAASGSPPFYLMAASLGLVSDHKQLIADVKAQIGDALPAVVCIDTLNRSLEGSESSDEDMGAYIRAADALRDAFDCLVVVVHHCGHNGERPRGHSSLIGAVDVQVSVRKDADGNVIAELELAKDGEPGLQFVSRLKQIEVGVDPDGDAITSCVLEAVEGGPVRAGKARTAPKSEQTALRALQRAIEEVGEALPSNTIPVGVRVVTVKTWRRYSCQMGISDSEEPEARRKAFARSHRALLDGNHVGAWEDYRWLP